MGLEMQKKCEWIDIPMAPKAVLMCLAYHHNDGTGQCDPSVARISGMIGGSISTVKRNLSMLEKCGFLKIEYRNNTSSSYKLTPLNGKSCWDYSKKPRNQSKKKDARVGSPCTQVGSPWTQSKEKEVGSPCTQGRFTMNPGRVHHAPRVGSLCAPNNNRTTNEQQQNNNFSAHAHATPNEPDQTASAPPQEKKDLVSDGFGNGQEKKPTGIIMTGAGSKQPERFDFRREYFEQTKRMPKDRMVELFGKWDEHKTGISRKGQWTDMQRKLFIGAIIRMESDHGTDAVCDQIEAAICGGYPGIVSPKDVSEAQRKAKIEREHCQVGFDDCSDLPF